MGRTEKMALSDFGKTLPIKSHMSEKIVFERQSP